MSAIVYDARYMKAFELLYAKGSAAGKQREFLDALWASFCNRPDLMGEFVYYLDHGCFWDKLQCMGYGLSDLYFYRMRVDLVSRDAGKSTQEDNKEALALDSFFMMAEMLEDPMPYVKKLEGGPGMDLLS